MSNYQRMKPSLSTLIFLGGSLCGSLTLNPSSVGAQIVPDRTLPVNSSVNVNGQVFQIDGGTQAGNNLFHSFREFSIPSGTEAFFNNSTAIQNILTRVTGSSVSNLDGSIRANGSANLFLINPKGIIFGPNSQLRVGGSFIASTASSIKFPDGLEFSATNPNANPLLSINVPLGLQFGNTVGDIVVRDSGKNANPENTLPRQPQTFGLIGGNLTISGANFGLEQGRLELGSVAESSFVRLVPLNNYYKLDYTDVQSFRDINLLGGAIAATGQGGDIQIQGRNVSITEGSQVFTNSTNAIASGNITLKTSQTLEVNGRSLDGNTPSNIATLSSETATGNAGNMQLDVQNLRVLNGGIIASFTSGAGNSGNIAINAADNIEVNGTSANGQTFSSILSTSFRTATGNAGNLILNATKLLIANGGFVSANSLGLGNAGKITVQARDRIDVVGVGKNGTPPSTLGSSGPNSQISIETNTLSLRDGGLLQGRNSGNVAAVQVKARDLIEILGEAPIGYTSQNGSLNFYNSQISTSTLIPNQASGAIQLETKTLNLQGGGSILATTFTDAKGGDIDIQASQRVEVNGSFGTRPSLISSDSGTQATGSGGTIRITTPELNIANRASISTESLGNGNAGNLIFNVGNLAVLGGGQISANTSNGKAGNIQIIASKSVELAGDRRLLETDSSIVSGSSISSSTNADGTGTGGDIFIQAPRLTILGGGNVSANTLGIGNAGNINIQATTIEVTGASTPMIEEGSSFRSASSISTNSVGIGKVRGQAGNITIDAQQIKLREGGIISSDTGSIGNAGNITIRATDALTVDGERPEGDDRRFPTSIRTTVSNSQSIGTAGNIVIETARLSVTGAAQILSATFGQGNAGDITIRAADTVEVSGFSPATGRISVISTSVGRSGIGNGGKLAITTGKLQVLGGGQIATSTLGQGNSGDLIVNATDRVLISGIAPDNTTSSGLYASTEAGATGQGGNLRVETNNLAISDRGQITVRDLAGAVGAGNLQIIANSIGLNNQGLLSAETRAGVRGNISIESSDLRLTNNSLIQANAFGTATGGNVSINTGAMAALTGSNITARAQDARGGQIAVNSQSVFVDRPRGTVFDASSALGPQFSGTVEIKTPDFDPSRGLVTLATAPVDASKLVAQRCLADQRDNEFIITGRGGLPPSPSETLGGNRLLENFGQISPQAKMGNPASPVSNANNSEVKGESNTSLTSLIEASNWAIAPNGQVKLIAAAPQSSVHPIWQRVPKCVNSINSDRH